MQQPNIVDMILCYIKRALEIVQKDGLISFMKSTYGFFINFLLSKGQIFKINTAKNHYINKIKYNSPANVNKVIYIYTKDIKKIARSDISFKNGLGQIKGGNWHNNGKYINETIIFQGMYERFQQGNDWTNTTIYQQAVVKFKHKKEFRCTKSIDEFLNRRCQYVDEIYENIKNNGYRKASEYENDTKQFRNDFTDELEVLVSIGPNGEIYLYDGQHRFAIAHMLDLHIPVQVICRHENWQKVRDDMNENSVSKYSEELQGHPDLQDIIN